jgi:hypothetical protein
MTKQGKCDFLQVHQDLRKRKWKIRDSSLFFPEKIGSCPHFPFSIRALRCGGIVTRKISNTPLREDALPLTRLKERITWKFYNTRKNTGYSGIR